MAERVFNVALVDDDNELQDLLAMRLGANGYRTIAFRTIAAAIAGIDEETFDAVLLDLRLPEGDGLSVLQSLSARAMGVPVVVLTAHGTIDLAVEALRLGADDFLTKPFHAHELLEKVRDAATRGSLRRDVRNLRRTLQDDPHHLIGASPAVARLREVIDRIGPTDATVLITGESGTGKELVARALHARSARRARGLVALNCAAIPEHLVEGELFGHAEGAFTHAHGKRAGVLAAAEGSTLLLDEVGDAPASVQARLLRVLEERSYRRVGDNTLVAADVRFIAATNRNLPAMVAAGTLRSDLLFRLHVVPIHIPPLRERREDIPLLAAVFFDRATARYEARPRALSARSFQALLAHDWPGNVRELANVIDHAVLCDAEITSDTLGRGNRTTVKAQPRAAAEAPDWWRTLLERFDGFEVPPLRDAREAFECAYVREVLRVANGNVSAAARIAGRHRSEFYTIMKRHHIGGPRGRTIG